MTSEIKDSMLIDDGKNEMLEYAVECIVKQLGIVKMGK